MNDHISYDDLYWELCRRLAPDSFMHFVKYTKRNYVLNWHHKIIGKEIQAFIDNPERKKLMIFVPPQHGKSELVSRRLAPWVIGRNPDKKIAITTHTGGFARGFARAMKRIIKSPEYKTLFPAVELPGYGSDQANTANHFDINGREGMVKAVGVDGDLTGSTVDLLIIDDVYKDRAAAESETSREHIKEWFDDVAETRLHNDSKIIFCITRWHELDLAGQLLKEQPGEWRVVRLPAIKEEETTHDDDPRKIGEAMWPERHSLERLRSKQKRNPYTFLSLYQQKPRPKEGKYILRHWFDHFYRSDLPGRIRVDFVADLAYTAKEENDPSGILAYCQYKNNFYILGYAYVWKRYGDLYKFIKDFCARFDPDGRGVLRIENKASGINMVQTLRDETDLAVMEYKLPNKDRKARLADQAHHLEAGRVYVLDGEAWLDHFLQELTAFDQAEHDESVDCVIMMLDSGDESEFVHAYG